MENRQRQRAFSMLAGTASTVLEKFASTVFLPALPAIAAFFAVDRALMQQAVPVLLLGIALSQFFWGSVSDHFGPRRVLLVLVPIYFAGTAVAGTASYFWLFLAGVFLQGFAVGAIFSVSQALLVIVNGKKQATRILALIALVASWASPAGAVLGGFLVHHLDWPACFAFLGLFVLGLGVLYFVLPAGRTPDQLERIGIASFFRGYRGLLGNAGYLGHVLVVAWLNFGQFVFLTVSPFFVIRDQGVSPRDFGLLMFIPFAGIAFGRFLCARLDGRLSTESLIYTGGLVALLGGVLLAGLELAGLLDEWTLMSGMAVYLVGLGLASPGARAQAMLAVAGLAGSAGSMMSVLVNLLGSVGSSLAGHLPTSAFGPLVLAGAACNLLLFRWMQTRVAADEEAR